jgi:hypothetical protein
MNWHQKTIKENHYLNIFFITQHYYQKWMEIFKSTITECQINIFNQSYLHFVKSYVSLGLYISMANRYGKMFKK